VTGCRDLIPTRLQMVEQTSSPVPTLDTGAEPALEIRTEPLGGSPLVRAALEGRVPPGWYPATPASPAAWADHIAAIRQQFRAGAWLELLAPAFDATGAAAERLIRSGGGAGIVVTTGQQPGLFGGPLYVLAKALSARALADALERATGVPVAPVFWAATDDADFAEASRTVVAFDAAAHELRAAATAPDGTPMASVPLGADMPALLRTLERAAGSAAFHPALDAAVDAYAAGATVGGAYLRLLRTLLQPLGIAVLDASHAAVRDGGFQLLRRALLTAASIEGALGERTAEIVAAGYRPQVPDFAGRSLVFRTDRDGRRGRVPIADARAIVPRVVRGELGPNVLLRPVVERFILPTAAYVAGPGEYAYFAQVSAVASALAVAQPVVVPRWSGTVIEPGVRRALTQLGLDASALRDPDAAAATVARRAMPPEVVAAIATLREATRDAGERLRRASVGEALGAAPCHRRIARHGGSSGGSTRAPLRGRAQATRRRRHARASHGAGRAAAAGSPAGTGTRLRAAAGAVRAGADRCDAGTRARARGSDRGWRAPGRRAARRIRAVSRGGRGAGPPLPDPDGDDGADRAGDPLPREPEPTPASAVAGATARPGRARSPAAALLVALGILLTRLFGLVRSRVTATILGTSDAADVFTAATRIPNFLQNLFGEGVLSASFIPVYARLLARGERGEADRVAGAVFGLLAATVAALVAVGVLATPLVVDVVASGFDGAKRALTIRLVRILFPGTGLLVLFAWCLGILNSHRRFFLSYVAPVVWNLAIIGALVWGGARGVRRTDWSSRWRGRSSSAARSRSPCCSRRRSGSSGSSVPRSTGRPPTCARWCATSCPRSSRAEPCRSARTWTSATRVTWARERRRRSATRRRSICCR
jgi:hypothetical protein